MKNCKRFFHHTRVLDDSTATAASSSSVPTAGGCEGVLDDSTATAAASSSSVPTTGGCEGVRNATKTEKRKQLAWKTHPIAKSISREFKPQFRSKGWMTMVRSCKLDGTKRRGALERRVADFEKHRFKRKYAVHRKDANPITAKRPKHDGDGRWITFEKAKAIAFYGKGLGLNVRQAAKHHGVSVDTISRTFRRMGSLVLTLMSVAVDAFWPRPAHDELE